MELVHERAIGLRDDSDGVYDRARVYGERQADGRWAGFIEFVGVDGRVVRTPRETTQRNPDDLAYWATGLEPVYFEGALDRALRAAAGDTEATPVAEPRPDLPLTRTAHRRIQQAAVLTYEGTVESPSGTTPGRFAFSVAFDSPNAAALLANFLWSTLHAEPVAVTVEGAAVELTNTALKETLLAAAA